MPRLQRHVTAFAALALAFVVAGCGAADRRAMSAASVDDTTGDTSSTVAVHDAAFAAGGAENGVDAALADGDLCGVYLGLAAYDVSTESTAGLMTQLERIRDVMRRAEPLVPEDIAADWRVIADGTADLLAALDKGKKFAAEHFDDDEYRGAASRVGDWMADNCA